MQFGIETLVEDIVGIYTEMARPFRPLSLRGFSMTIPFIFDRVPFLRLATKHKTLFHDLERICTMALFRIVAMLFQTGNGIVQVLV
jgi:hypothetical protein